MTKASHILVALAGNVKAPRVIRAARAIYGPSIQQPDAFGASVQQASG